MIQSAESFIWFIWFYFFQSGDRLLVQGKHSRWPRCNVSKSSQNEITSIQQMHEKNNNHSSVEWAISTFIAFTQLDWIGNKESKLLSGTVIRCPAFQYSPTRPTVGQLNTGITLLLGLIANCVPLVSNISGSRESLKIMSRNEKNGHISKGGKKRRRKLLLSSCLFCDSNLSLLWPPFACCITVSSRLPLAH